MVEAAEDLDCWTPEHMALFQAGMSMIGVTVFLAAGILPVLKSQRGGVEKRWSNESYFAGIYKLQIAGLILFFCPIRIPTIGLVFTALTITYVIYHECYSDLHIASVKLGLLTGQLWLFICAESNEDDGEAASGLLAWWPAAFAVGYSVLFLKSLILKRVPKDLPIEK